jgi:hypothetical protein
VHFHNKGRGADICKPGHRVRHFTELFAAGKHRKEIEVSLSQGTTLGISSQLGSVVLVSTTSRTAFFDMTPLGRSAARTGVSPFTSLERVRLLREHGIIIGHHLALDLEASTASPTAARSRRCGPRWPMSPPAPTAPVHFAENPLHLAVTDRAGDNASA